MARNDRKKTEENNTDLMKDKGVKGSIRQINNILGQANLNLYGTDRTSDVDSLNNTFQQLLHSEIDSLTQKNNEDITSFLSKLYSNDKKTVATNELLDNQFMSMSGDEYNSMQGFIFEAYRNKLLEQSDLHEVASQLIELSEAILITRDAIISADTVEGRMSRTIHFEKLDKESIDDNLPIVENIEKRFELLDKIKNFIVPKTLEYGEYYVYIIPYSRIFNDFMRNKNNNEKSNRFYRETTLFESVMNDNENGNLTNKKVGKETNTQFAERLYQEYVTQDNTKDKSKEKRDGIITEDAKPDKEEFVKDINNILKNVKICNSSVPLPVLEEGVSSIYEYMTEYVNESGDKVLKEANSQEEPKNLFNQVLDSNSAQDGITYTTDKKNNKEEDFSDIKDCYIKLIEPTKIIPIKIMNQVIGYYFVQAEDISPLSGMVSSTLYYSKFDENRHEQTIIDSIAERIVSAFDKNFLKDNLKFKETIVEAINYYNLNEKRIKFQFIPVEYIQEFKIDKDEDGNGQSMIKKSLFYAKLYLMILLFKIMSIILNSNDQKVNYIRQSGIDKNMANKVQEIARIKQSRQINIMDLFNYSTLINKVGNGTEMYVPTGRNNERPIETEILSGQEVQLNTELLEMLKNSYILGTGVPAAIVNYLNEADFAKVVEQNNTKFNGRVVNYQLDFNPSITEMYKKIMKWSSNIEPNIIENFSFTLQPPKTVASNAKGENIDGFNRLAEFLVGLKFDDPNSSTDENLNDKIRKFRNILAKEQLPMIDMDKIDELFKQSILESKKEALKPDPINGDDGDDGFENELNNM